MPKHRMCRLYGMVLVSACLFFSVVSCGNSYLIKSDNALLKQAFKAIKNQDWEAYKPLTVTTADFIVRKLKISVIKARQSYYGSILKPEEMKKHRDNFDKAKNDPKEQRDKIIDFTKESYISPGRVIKSGVIETLEDTEITYRVYAIKTRTPAGEEKEGRIPYFMVADWDGYKRILHILFPPEEGEENGN